MKVMSWPAFIILMCGIACAVLLIAFRFDVMASTAMAIASLLSFVFYIYEMYTYISAAFTGIDSTWEASFFICTILFLAALILSVAAFCVNFKAVYKVQKVLVSTSSILLAVICLGNVIANENSAAINKALHIDTFEIIGEGDGDSEYYKSKYKNLKELKAAGEEKAEEAMGEGAVLLKNENKALPLTQREKGFPLRRRLRRSRLRRHRFRLRRSIFRPHVEKRHGKRRFYHQFFPLGLVRYGRRLSIHQKNRTYGTGCHRH